ncbi:MAG TPA: ACT domain-containing protein, partial [Holophaga sp.]|nr:ACT domain-containing protein [Holophaga sp.]
MNITQISVFLENKPGRLQHVLKALADRDINLRTLTIAEVNDFGILRMIVNHPDDAYAALKAEHVTCSRTDVLAVALQDTPGALYRLIETFSRRQINIEYMYAFTDRHDAESIM